MTVETQKTRWQRFVCWFKYGHLWDQTKSHRTSGMSVNTCLRCGERCYPG